MRHHQPGRGASRGPSRLSRRHLSDGDIELEEHGGCPMTGVDTRLLDAPSSLRDRGPGPGAGRAWRSRWRCTAYCHVPGTASGATARQPPAPTARQPPLTFFLTRKTKVREGTVPAARRVARRLGMRKVISTLSPRGPRGIPVHAVRVRGQLARPGPARPLQSERDRATLGLNCLRHQGAAAARRKEMESMSRRTSRQPRRAGYSSLVRRHIRVPLDATPTGAAEPQRQPDPRRHSRQPAQYLHREPAPTLIFAPFLFPARLSHSECVCTHNEAIGHLAKR